MATKTFEELKQLAIQIRDEKTNKANTATRIGTQMIEHLNKLEQEYYNIQTVDGLVSEYNVSVNHPTSGIDGSNKYTLSSAIALVPKKYRSIGIKCAFINEAGQGETWEWKGGSWTVGSFSNVGPAKFTSIENGIAITNITTNSKIFISENEVNVEKSNYYSGEVGSNIVKNYSKYNSYKAIPCKRGDVFTISTIGGVNGVAYYVTDKNGLVIEKDDSSKNYINSPKDIIILHENASFLYINCIATINSDTYYKIYIQKINSELQTEFESINNRLREVENISSKSQPIYAKDGGAEVKLQNFYSGEVGGKIMANLSSYNSFMPIQCKKGDIIEICTKGGQNGVAYYVTDAEQIVLSMDSKGMNYLDAPIKLEITDENAALLFINIIVLPTSIDTYNKVFYKQYSVFTLLEDRVEKLESDIGSKITDGTTEYFKVKVTGKPWLTDNNFESMSSDILADSTEYDDNCIYYQPQCKENAVKLVVYCHGGSQFVGGNSSEGFITGNPLEILKKLGYAYLCCNCYPYDYMHGVLGIGTGVLADSAPVGNWTIMQAYSKALNYVLNKYNIDKDNIFLMGVSQGGMTAENIAELMDINFKAECILEPAISMQFVQPSIRGSYLQAMYGFSTPETFSLDKVHGLDPFSRNTDSESGLNKNSSFEDCIAVTTKKYRKGSPLLILQGKADNVVSAKWTAAYAKMIQNAGGQCEYILYQGLDHSSLQGGNKGTIDGAQFGAPCIEMAKWFEKFGGYSTENIIIS